MKPADEKRIAAKLAKLMGLMCVRNTGIEAIHTGVTPITKTGDYSDVVVLDANGRKIPWAEVSHLDDDAMRDLMRQIVGQRWFRRDRQEHVDMVASQNTARDMGPHCVAGL